MAKKVHKIRDVKIVNGIIAIFISSMIFVLIVCSLGYYGMRRMNENINSMYYTNVMHIVNSTSMRSEFMDIMINENKAFQIYSNEYNKEIKLHDLKLREYIKDYESAQVTEEEKKYLTVFTGQYDEFINLIDKINISLEKEARVTFDDRDKLNSMSLSMQINLNKLRDYNLSKAKILSVDNNNVYYGSTGVFFLVVFLGLLLIVPLSLIIINSIRKSSKELINDLNTIATGDFSLKIETEGTNEFASIKKVLSNTLKDISGILENVRYNSHGLNQQSNKLSDSSFTMKAASESLTKSIDSIATGTNLQGDNLKEIYNIMSEFSLELEKTVIDIEKVDYNSKNIGVMAESSSKDMRNLNNSVNELSQSFNKVNERVSSFEKQISDINEMAALIKKISDQTHLLALNAAIEAASAGEAGRGFSVVADEIRRLAENSKISSDNINKMARELTKEAIEVLQVTAIMKNDLNKQLTIIDNAAISFSDILVEVNSIIPEISKSGKSMARIKSEKNIVIDKIESTTGIAKDLMDDYNKVSAAANSLDDFALSLSDSACRFNFITKDMILSVNRFKTCSFNQDLLQLKAPY